jgi:hypothetical protein
MQASTNSSYIYSIVFASSKTMESHFAANLKSSKIIILFLTIVFAFAEAKSGNLQETKMSLYFHDFSAGPNATLAKVAGIPGKLWDFFSFGTIFVTDDPITKGIDRNSPEIARGQGIYVTSSLNGANTHVLFSIVFTNKEYNGSTLEIQGRSIQLAPVREVSIVSGTGKFRFGRGYATFETVYYDPSIFYSVERCNITVLHPFLA